MTWYSWSASNSVGDAGLDGGSSTTSLWSESNSVDGLAFDGPKFGRGACAPGKWNHVGYTGLDSGAPIPVNKWSDSVDGPGFGSACAPTISGCASDIVDDAGLDDQCGASSSIDSYPDPDNDSGLGGSGDHSSGPGIDGGGCPTPVDPSAGLDGGELDDRRAADDSSCIGKWPSWWIKNLSPGHSSFNSLPRFSNMFIRICPTSTPA
jgi:hypothetical protein